MRKLLSTLAFSILMISCSKDDDNSDLLRQYEGPWSGTYTGANDNGTWSLIVEEDGAASGQAFSIPLAQSFPINGTIEAGGNINLTTGSAGSGATFSGTVDIAAGT